MEEKLVLFELGETQASGDFLQKNPRFPEALEFLGKLSNEIFGRRCDYESRVDDVCFGLGHTCREEFFEIAFLAANGYPRACYVILRGLFERALTVEYIHRNPDRATRFYRYAAIQEHRSMESAIKAVGEETFDAQMGPEVTQATLRENYKAVKGDFQITDCKTCGTTRLASSWDLDIGAMTHRVGAPFKDLYFFCYSLPNLYIHATYASGLKDASAKHRDTPHQREMLVYHAGLLLLAVLRTQNEHFRLNLAERIAEAEECVKGGLVVIN